LIILGIAVLLLSPTGQTFLQSLFSEFKPTQQPPSGYVYSGNLKVNLVCYDIYDDSVVTPTNIVFKIWHADQATLFGTRTGAGSDYITGQVNVADNGILYLSIDHAATTSYYTLDSKTDMANGMLTALSPKDVDADGILEHYFKLDVTSLTPLQAGETQKEITLNLYFLNADTAGLSWTATINPSSTDLSGSTYIDLTAEGYLTGVTEGDGFKIVRVELTMPNAGNETYVEDGKVKNVWVSIGDYKWTVLSWQPGQDRFLVWEATDVTQEVYGKELFYAKNAGTTWCTYKVHIQGANFASAAVWNPTLKITIINPAGTISTITQSLTFTDT
ncbi:MAG: hypothetical protein ACPLZY_03940, partial [Candidatus Norongarragalinales archaeon]